MVLMASAEVGFTDHPHLSCSLPFISLPFYEMAAEKEKRYNGFSYELCEERMQRDGYRSECHEKAARKEAG